MSDTYLIRAADIAAMPGIGKTHFLNPRARRTNKSLGDATGLTGLGVHVIEVEPGDETTEFHVHHDEDECVFVLDGHATARIGDDYHDIGPGDFIGYRKGGAAHAIRNTGGGLLRLIVVGERRPHDVADYPRLGRRIYRHEGRAPDLVDIDAIAHPVMGAKK